MKFDRQVALVTGSGRGIGLAIATEFCRQGARVALLDWNVEIVKSAGESLRAQGFETYSVSADVKSRADVVRAVADVSSHLGPVEILVNNAGITRDGLVEKITDEQWDEVLDVNLKGAFLLTQAVVPGMKEKGQGSIVNISSRSWLGNIGQANYSASKGGLISLTRTLALELAKHQIRVNAVAPGLIDTDMTRALPDKVKEKLLRMQPTGRMGRVEDIARAVSFLASSDAEFVTGQVLHVDGGKSCGILSL